MTATAMNHSIHPKPGIEAGNWQVLRPPIQSDNGIEVGVVEVHPAIHNRVVYATRTRSEQNHDLENELVVIQDFDRSRSLFDNPLSNPDDGCVIACFSLEELVKCLNDFQQTHSLNKETLPHLSINAIASWTEAITVHNLGAVQHLSFLDREAIRTIAAPGYVKDRPSTDGIYKLMIGFRRCIVTVTLFKSKSQKESYARGLSVQAYIGPDDFDEYEGATKAKKKLPSSYAVPISEHIVAFGCYDGGLRLYDLLQRKIGECNSSSYLICSDVILAQLILLSTVKSALGPNGRSNPVVRVMNVNPIIHSGDVTPQTIMPKIVTACASGVAYVWELDLSIDVMSGEIFFINIPPPIASFDGMVAAVSGKGVPVMYHPSLSPTSIASLSPCSSWEQTDMINSQFDLSFDPQRNIMFWTFSPDCVAVSLLRHASREERLNTNGSLVAWDLNNLPQSDWPPPVAIPCCVMPLMRTEKGRILSSMVLPGILNNITAPFMLSTVYVTSSGEIVTAITDMTTQRNSVQRDVLSLILSDLDELRFGDIYSITASRMQPSLIAMGTQYGVLLTQIHETDNYESQLMTIDEETSVLFSVADQTQSTYHTGQKSMYVSSDFTTSTFGLEGCSVNPLKKNKQTLHDTDRVTNVEELKARLVELETRNGQLENDLEGTVTRSEASSQLSENRERELRAQMTSILEQQQQFCDATKDELQSALKSIETLQAALEAKEKSCATLENDLGTLRHEFDSVKSKLEQEESMAHDTPSQAVEILEKQLASKDQVCKNLQDEINSLKLVHDKEQRSNEARIEELECALASTERSSVMSHETSESLENELAELKEKEESLRDYVELLEKDKAQLDEELDLAKQKFDSYEKAKRDQQVFIKEQKETIDSLVDLLDKREQDHEAKNASYEAEISELLSKCEDLQQKLSTEEENAAQAELKMISTETANSNLRKENHALESALFQKNALYCAMKTELQNALNDLAVYEQAREQQRNSR